MKKAELVADVAAKTNLSQKQCDEVIKGMLETIKEAVEKGEEVAITGYFTIAVKERAERQGRNPRTGEVRTIPKTKVVKIKPGKILKDAAVK